MDSLYTLNGINDESKHLLIYQCYLYLHLLSILIKSLESETLLEWWSFSFTIIIFLLHRIQICGDLIEDISDRWSKN